jgi:hypothetical protein
MQIISINVRRMKTWQERNEQNREYYIFGLRLQDETYLEQLVHHSAALLVLRILGLSVRDSIRIC